MDKILVRGLRVFAYHGVNPEERENGQEFILDLTLSANLSEPGTTDRLEDTVNYAAAAKLAAAVMLSEKNFLLERAATRVAEAMLDAFPVYEVTVRLKKPHAPVKAEFDYMAVEITRSREQMPAAGGDAPGNGRGDAQ